MILAGRVQEGHEGQVMLEKQGLMLDRNLITVK